MIFTKFTIHNRNMYRLVTPTFTQTGINVGSKKGKPIPLQAQGAQRVPGS